VQVLANEAIRLDIPIFNRATAIRILVQPEPPRRVCDVLVVRPKHHPKKPTVGPLPGGRDDSRHAAVRAAKAVRDAAFLVMVRSNYFFAIMTFLPSRPASIA
jgi:hypothetical protein